MLKETFSSILQLLLKFYLIIVIALCLVYLSTGVSSCSPGRSGARRRSTRKLTPFVFKQHVPNVAEHSLGASGPSEGRIWRDDVRFRNLVPNYNSDIVFKDEEGTGVDRLMTPRCKEKLDILAISVMNMWPGIRLRVTEGFDEDGHHPRNSLHYEGRAVAISTSDRDTSKYGMLARLAVDAGFDWVFYESRTHIYCSVKTESTVPSSFSGCFQGKSTVMTKTGRTCLHNLQVGDEVLSSEDNTVLSFSKVIGFLHRDPSLEANFIRLRISSNKTLTVTPKHLIFRRKETVFASHVKPGDLILTETYDGTLSESVVLSVENVTLTGVYAPLTDSGTILVDGVLSSCYAVIDNHSLAHLVFFPVRLFFEVKDIYVSMFRNIWPALAWERDSDIMRKPYVNPYAMFLCEFSGMFVNICK